MIIFVIFAVGLMVTALVAKGLMQARDYANDEFLKQNPGKQDGLDGE